MQKTILSNITMTGVGLHSGKDINLSIKPALENAGITFIRTDVIDKNNVIPARWDHVTETQLCTVISNEDNVKVGTIDI